MLRLLPPDAEFEIDVPVTPPDGGEEMTCTARVVLLATDAATAALREGDLAFTRTVLRGWSGIADHQGSPIEWSEEARDRLGNVPYFARALALAYLSWAAAAPGKNSKAPPLP